MFYLRNDELRYNNIIDSRSYSHSTKLHVHGRRKGGAGGGLSLPEGPSWILKYLAKKVVFLVLSGKPPSWKKIWNNPLVAPPGTNCSAAHVHVA